MRNKKLTAWKGEEFVYTALPGAQWLNQNGEAWKHYDILWEDIRIDVKTTHRREGSDKFYFSDNYGRKTLFVFVGIENDDTYCWVSSKTNPCTSVCSDTSLQKSDIPHAIKEAWKENLMYPFDKFELAYFLGTHYMRIEKLVEEGLPYSMKGICLIFNIKEVLAWIQEKQEMAKNIN